jgi:hypothetical protein
VVTILYGVLKLFDTTDVCCNHPGAFNLTARGGVARLLYHVLFDLFAVSAAIILALSFSLVEVKGGVWLDTRYV